MMAIVVTKPSRVGQVPPNVGNSGSPAGRLPVWSLNSLISSCLSWTAAWYGQGLVCGLEVVHTHPHVRLQPVAEGSVLETGKSRDSLSLPSSIVNAAAYAHADSAPRNAWKQHKVAHCEGHMGPSGHNGSSRRLSANMSSGGISTHCRAGPMPRCVEAAHLLWHRSSSSVHSNDASRWEFFAALAKLG